MSALSIRHMNRTVGERQISVSDNEREDSGLDGDPVSEVGKENIRHGLISRVQTQNNLMYDLAAIKKATDCGCFSCSGALENLATSYSYYFNAPKGAKKYARVNVYYFQSELNKIASSKALDHEGWKV